MEYTKIVVKTAGIILKNKGIFMKKRLTQWDLLRALAMFFVVIVHSRFYLKTPQACTIAGELALICDPIFFTLSGYFAIRQLTSSYAGYLWKKFLTVVLPLIAYGALLYCFAIYRGITTLSIGNLMRFYQQLLAGQWWFIPALIPFLMLAPWLYTMFEALDVHKQRSLFILVSAAMIWGIIATALSSWAKVFQYTGATAAIDALTLFVSPALVPGSYFVYFCLGYFVKILPTLISKETLQKLCGAGIVLWIVGAVSSAFGYNRADPSYLWFFGTIAMFYLFSKVRITQPVPSKIISFMAQRSYSVYLFNYAAINLIFEKTHVCGLLTAENPATLTARFPLWILAVIVAYCVAFICACVGDYLILKPLQKLLKKIYSQVTSQRTIQRAK